MNNYLERIMRSKGNKVVKKVVKKVKEEPTKPVKKKKRTKKVEITNENVRYEILKKFNAFLGKNTYEGIEVVHDLKLFKDISDVIIANRLDKELEDCKEFIYSRDIFSRD